MNGRPCAGVLSRFLTWKRPLLAARRLGAVLKEAEIPVKVFAAGETTHRKLNANLGLSDDPATKELFKLLGPLMGAKR